MERTALLTAIIENAIDGIITIDELGKVESINPSACNLFGYSSDEVLGMNISMLMPVPSRDEHDMYLRRYKRTNEPHMIGKGREVLGLRKNGITFPFRLGLSEVQYSGRKIYTGFIHDLSKEKQADELLRRHTENLELQVAERTMALNKLILALQKAKHKVTLSLKKEKELGQLKSRFVSLASHEFRTPLSAVLLSAVLIEKYAEPFENSNITKHVVQIKNMVSSLTTILNDFLSHEKLEAGKEIPVFNWFDLVELSEEITEEMQIVSKTNQNIIYQHSGPKGTIKLDKNLLRHCVTNLIANAIKYSGENTFIDFTTSIDEEVCIIKVKDNGIGIPEKDQESLFQPFFRAHNTGNIPGTGLGLNIVARYVSLMRGKIECKSTVNQGAMFTIFLPLK